MSEIKIAWGDSFLEAELPPQWRVNGVMEPSPRPGVDDPAAETRRALQTPIGLPKLSEMVRPGMKVAVVIDDASRPTPVHLILPEVIAELERGGAQRGQVTLVPALGVHRPMTSEEVEQRVGPGWLPDLAVEHHDIDSPERLVNLGTTRRGTPVLINRVVAEADLVVAIGCIEPHIIASFGGGYKNIIPGVAGRATIAHNHALNCRPDTFNMVGQPIEANPMRLDLEEGASMLKPPVFIVNAVLNDRQKVVEIVTGHPIQAHRAGAAISASIYGVKIPRLADVVITASHPMDQDLRQGVKALANTVRAMKPGGMIINLVRAEEGVGVFGLANKKLPVSRQTLKIIAPILLPLVPKLKLSSMGEEDRFFLYFALQAMRRGDLLLYGPTIPQQAQDNLVFVQFTGGLDEALEKARARFPGAADVLVFPYGGSTYPILPA